ncbi:MAG: bifunctional alpha,alpha-trehalose-phosphate synthase (UDP-forming)/trehalose-phosphatase [Archangium sp.]|nr:bifunctional alpha,alpha-trehalose-phosphate synthase (UDP-forming)/trehalose-phosphatase [Archangium sp.]
MNRLLLVSNRLPITLIPGADGPAIERSTGGLATALSSVHGDGRSLWFGWPGPAGNDLTPEFTALLAEQHTVPVEISAAEVKAYYEGFSNGVLWPLCHYLLDKVRLDAHEDWEAYRLVNERFAERIAREWKPGDAVWVHDYQLALVPALLRQRCPEARIGFFLHVPFPAPEIFRILPWRTEVLRGILGADVVGFHTAQYAFHFAYACSQLLGLELAGDVLRDDGRPVRVAAFPIGIDAEAFATRAASEEVQRRAAELRAGIPERTLLVAVDRLDYTKGLPRRLLALERLLTQRPELRDKLHFIQLAVPTRENVDAYADYRRTVNELVSRVNGRFGTPTRNVVHLLHRSVDPVELSALYVAADVMLVTPLRDGMNLVAKEYAASRIDDSGVLVLSEFAGAATELHEALHVNPYDLDALASAILRAIEMPGDERALRMAGLRRSVHGGSVHRWARSFVTSLEESPIPPAIAPTRALEEAAQALRDAEPLVAFLDYDGTLVDFSTSPRTATPDRELLRVLERLAKRATVHVVSGRSRESLEDFFGSLPIGLHAEHGLWSRKTPHSPWTARLPVPPTWLAPLREVFEGIVRRTDGAFLEEKSGALAFHYRSTEPQLAQRRLGELRLALAAHPASSEFDVLPGARVLEVRQRGIHKGVVVPEVLAALPSAAVIAIGDDLTDEALFGALPERAVAVRVGRGQSIARFRVPGVREVRALLASLTETT